MGWPADFSPGFVKTIGAFELLGAIGLILPGLIDTAPILTPVAAVGLAAIQTGAVVVHARRKETQMIFVNIVLIRDRSIHRVGEIRVLPPLDRTQPPRPR